MIARIRGTRPRCPHSLGERGVSTVEAMLATIAALTLLFAGVQVTLWYHAANVALGAAEQGARAASATTGDAAGGEDAAAGYLDAAGGEDVLRESVVSADRNTVEAMVTVTGYPHSVIPGWSGPQISRTAVFPVERTTTP